MRNIVFIVENSVERLILLGENLNKKTTKTSVNAYHIQTLNNFGFDQDFGKFSYQLKRDNYLL